MTMLIRLTATFLAFAAAPLALARPGGAHFTGAGIVDTRDNLTMIDPQQSLSMRASDVQRQAFAQCMSVTEAARLAGRLVGDKSYWHGKRGRFDLGAVYRGKPQLQLALTDMTAAHQQFLGILSQDQDTMLGPDLRHLEQLQTSLNLEMSQLNEEMRAVRSDKFRVSTSVYEIGHTMDKWRSEHKRIAKKMRIAIARHSFKQAP